jgi:hypothetical protein
MDPASMDFQTMFDIVLGAFAFLCGFILNAIWSMVKTLTDRVTHIEVLVAGKYITREELRSYFSALDVKLERIHERLNKKEDKA